MPPKLIEASAVVPVPGRRNLLITSALPYVNDMPHLGNIIGSVLSADVFARYCRARGLNTVYIGGTDGYGTTTEIRASGESCMPKELCDSFHKKHAGINKWFNISYDKFGRTTTQNPTEIAQQVFSKVNDNAYLDERVTTRLYCESHARFLADRYVVGDRLHCGKDAKCDECDACGSFDEAIELKNPRLDRLQPQVRALFDESSAKGKWSSNRTGQTVGWFKKGLKERSITRDIKFGTPVPPDILGFEDKVIYNWFDAPIGYLSITAEYTDKWRNWWQPHDADEVELYQFIGKDNMFFHSIFFPATQIATGDNWTKVYHLSTTEFLQYEGTKFSKSRGIGVFGDQDKDSKTKADVWRFYHFITVRDSDTEFTWDTFIAANNSHLNNNLGNFVNRVIKFVTNPRPRGYGRIVPDGSRLCDADGSLAKWKENINSLLSLYLCHLDAVKLRAALITVVKISTAGDELAQKASRLFKGDREECGAYLKICLNLIHLLTAILQPFLPDTADSIARQLGVDPVLSIPDTFDCGFIRPGHQLGEAECLFTKIDLKRAEEWKAHCGGSGSKGVISGVTSNGKKSKDEYVAPGVSRRSKESDNANQPREKREEHLKSEAAALDGSASVEGGLAQALRPMSFE